MARDFVASSSERLEWIGTPPVTSTPLTMACWSRLVAIDTNYHLMGIFDESDTAQEGFSIAADGSTTGDPCRAWATEDSEWLYGIAESTAGFSANNWHHFCGVFTSSTSRAAFLDGGNKGTNSDNFTPTAAQLDITTIGCEVYSSGTRGAHTDGRIAEAAIWDAALTDAEVAALALGYSPLLIRPGNLVFYVPLVRDNDEDIVGGLSFSVNGTPTVAPHVPVFYPATKIFAPPVTAVSDLNVAITDSVDYQYTGVKVVT